VAVSPLPTRRRDEHLSSDAAASHPLRAVRRAGVPKPVVPALMLAPCNAKVSTAPDETAGAERIRSSRATSASQRRDDRAPSRARGPDRRNRGACMLSDPRRVTLRASLTHCWRSGIAVSQFSNDDDTLSSATALRASAVDDLRERRDRERPRVPLHLAERERRSSSASSSPAGTCGCIERFAKSSLARPAMTC